MLKKGYFEHLVKCFWYCWTSFDLDELNLTKYFLPSVRFPGLTHHGNKASTNHTHFCLPALFPLKYMHIHIPIHSPPWHSLYVPTRGLLEIWRMMLEKTDEIAQQHQRVAEVMLSQISEEMRQQKRIKEQTFKRVSGGYSRPQTPETVWWAKSTFLG